MRTSSPKLIELVPGILGHASGAVWLPDDSALVVADVHLGYAWAQRRRGQLGPLVDGDAEARLTALLDEIRPRMLVLLGDLVHAPRPSPPERQAIERAVRVWQSRAAVVLVRGNHDRSFERDFSHLAVTVMDHWRGHNTMAVHGDRVLPEVPSELFLLLGHWHPTVSITDLAGASQRIRAFLLWKRVCVLPAFSPLSAGFDVSRGIPAGLAPLYADGDAQVVAATGTRVVKLGPIRMRLRRKNLTPPERT